MLLSVVCPTAGSAQRPMTASTPAEFRFDGFGATGFMPPPVAVGALDSHEIVPIGFAPDTPFAGVCLSTPCTRGVPIDASIVLLPGFWALGPGGASPFPADVLAVQPRADAVAGIRIRVRNTDVVPLVAFDIDVHWWSRARAGLLRNNLLVRPVDCVTGSPRAGVTFAVSDIMLTWARFTQTFTLGSESAPPGGELCFDLVTTDFGRDVIAFESITVSAENGCGNGVMDPGEDCEPLTGDDACACDPSTCLFPPELTPCENHDGNPCSGACVAHECADVPSREGELSSECEDGVACTPNGCRGGACAVLSLPPDCCLGPEDCVANTCELASCDLNACVRRPMRDCDAGARMDAPVAIDAPLEPRPDAPFDARPPATVSFAGGGGCRCTAVRTRPAPLVSVWLSGLVVALAARRRRPGSRGEPGPGPIARHGNDASP